MKKTTGMLTVILLVLIVSNKIFAQEVKNLTLEESIKIGLENSRQLHSYKMGVVSSRAKLSEVNAMRLPSLSFNGSYTRLSSIDPYSIQTPFGDFDITQDIVNQYNLKLTLQQPIFTGFRLSGTSEMAEYSYEAAQQDFSADENTMVYNIKNAYWSLFKAIQFKNVIDENVAQVKAHLEDIQNLFKQGLTTKNDMLRVQVQLSEAELRQIDARNGVRLAMISLNNTIGLPLSTQLQIQEDVKSREDNLRNIDELTETAFANRPELKAMEFRVKASETGIKIAESSWWPQLVLQGNYSYARPNQRIFPSTDEFNGTWDVTVALQMNLWNWGQTSDQTTQAETQYEQAKDTYYDMRDGVTLEVTQNYLNVMKASEKVVVSEGSVNQAQENYRVTSEKFKNGLILNSDLIDAEVDLLQARTNYVQSIVDYELAKANLEKSIGQK